MFMRFVASALILVVCSQNLIACTAHYHLAPDSDAGNRPHVHFGHCHHSHDHPHRHSNADEKSPEEFPSHPDRTIVYDWLATLPFASVTYLPDCFVTNLSLVISLSSQAQSSISLHQNALKFKRAIYLQICALIL